MAYPSITVDPSVSLCLAANYIRLVVVAVYSYNAVLTFGDEVNFIWMKNWTLPGFVYIVAKYLTGFLLYEIHQAGLQIAWFIQPSMPGLGGPFVIGIKLVLAGVSLIFALLIVILKNKFRTDSGSYPIALLTYGGAVVLFCAMVLLQIRAYAICEKSRFVLWTFCLLSFAALTVFILEVTLFPRLPAISALNSIENLYTSLSSLTTGSSTRQKTFSPFFWLPFFLVETASFFFVVYKAAKRHRCPRSLDPKHTSATLFDIIVRDNILYYSAIFVVYLFGICLLDNTLLKQFSFKSFDYLSFSIAVSGTLAPNLFLGLKKGFYEEQERLAGGDSYATPFHASAPTNLSISGFDISIRRAPIGTCNSRPEEA